MAQSKGSEERPPGREIFEATISGAQARPFIPRLRSDPPVYETYKPLPHSLVEFREREGRAERKRLLYQMWKELPRPEHYVPNAEKAGLSRGTKLTPLKAEKLKLVYEEELLNSCGGLIEGNSASPVNWKEFKAYSEAKEAELWDIFHNELDLDGNGHLDAEELALALGKAGITLSPSTLVDFMTHLTSSPHSHAVSFEEFRGFLLLLPRKISAAEIYRYYEVRKFMGEDGRGAGRVTMEGDVTLSAEDHPRHFPLRRQESAELPVDHSAIDDDEYDDDDFIDDHDQEYHSILDGHPAIKFLLAGGVAGAVSRTCTAPFDRLKIFLMTRPPDLGGMPLTPKPGLMGAKAIANAISRIYSEGGILAFWTGNGLSVTKIFPESAIKFMTYENTKRAFAKYVDHVEDSRDISGTSRFLSGGMGGIVSQLSIYPMETLKTQMMSSTGNRKGTMVSAMRHLWQMGGVRYFYRGLSIGLVGVFPYSAIDMSTFEALKLAYLRSTGKEEPGVLAILAFGSVSGSVGATSVYPLNLVRTRLQASGSSGHPQKYTGVWDVASQTYQRDGWRGFYRGLFPTLAKVVPAVSISYMVYEHTKRRLGV